MRPDDHGRPAVAYRGRADAPALSRLLDALHGGMSARAEARTIIVVTATLLLVAILLLALPGRTVSTIYAHDVMVYLDGAHRLLSGQVPNRDFHTPLGLAAYLLPALGLKVTGSLGGTMPATTIAFALMAAPVLLYICLSRLPLGLSLIVILYLGIVAVAPLNPGESHHNISFGMFYNRFCWVAISLLFLLFTPWKQGGAGHIVLDAACAALLVLFLLYTKISYGLIAFVFLVGLALHSRTRIAGFAAIVAVGACIALFEAIEPTIGAYVDDILLAAHASGSVRNGMSALVGATLRDILPIGLLLTVVAIVGRRGLKLGTLIAVGFMLLAGLLIINQNTQHREIVTLVPAAVVALRSQIGAASSPVWPQGIGMLLTALIAAPNSGHAAAALLNHTRAAATDQPESESRSTIDGLLVIEAPASGFGLPVGDTLRAPYAAGSASLMQLNLARSLTSAQPLTQPEYFWTLRDGMSLLRRRSDLSGPIFVLDMINPFSVLLSRPAPRGDSSWHHFGRTFSDTAYIPAERMLADADVVMEPKNPVAFPTAFHLSRIYGGYLRRNFRLVAESTYWRAYRRVPPVLPISAVETSRCPTMLSCSR